MAINYKEIILEALRKVVAEHGYVGTLKNRDIHEQALSHRLAVHLENSGFFTGYHIDCEYNRYGEESKKNNFGERIRPDIVIHVRGGKKRGNLIIIQNKKFNDPPAEIDYAVLTLRKDKKFLNYTHAFLVKFPENLDANSADLIVEI